MRFNCPRPCVTSISHPDFPTKRMPLAGYFRVIAFNSDTYYMCDLNLPLVEHLLELAVVMKALAGISEPRSLLEQRAFRIVS